MKTKNILTLAGLIIGSFVVKGQTNVVSTTTVIAPGGNNVIVGKSAGLNLNSTAYFNTFVGSEAGSNTNNSSGTTGYTSNFNVFIGYQSGLTNTLGFYNTFLGNKSGLSNTIGKNNLFIGSQAGSSNTVGNENVYLGELAGVNNVTGIGNTYVGRGAGAGTQNISGSSSVYIGSTAGIYNEGNNNTIIGTGAGHDSHGNNNVYLGKNAGGMITGNSNVIIGPLIGDQLNTFSNQLLIGNSAVFPLLYGDFANRFINLPKLGIGIANKNTPANTLEINCATGGSGLRFTNLNSSSTPVASNGRVLTVNSVGDVVLTTDQGSGGTTLINAGTNVTVAGNGSVATPYIISATGGATTNTLTNTDNTITSTVGGIVATAPAVNTVSNTISNGTLVTTVNGVASTAVILPTSTTSIIAGSNTTVTGDGSVATPYVISATGGADTSIYNDNGSINSATTIGGNREVTLNNSNIWFKTSSANANDNIYIGETPGFPTATGNYKLYVEGGVLTEKVKVALRSTTNWADYVFAKDYKLTPLKEVANFIKTNQHLPGVARAAELVKNGLDLGAMQATQMAKIEELTLYAIEQDKKLDKQAKEIEELKAQVKSLIEKNK